MLPYSQASIVQDHVCVLNNSYARAHDNNVINIVDVYSKPVKLHATNLSE